MVLITEFSILLAKYYSISDKKIEHTTLHLSG